MRNHRDDSQVSRSLIMVHGRLVNDQSQVYQLAADDEEVERLDNQHIMLKQFLGGNYRGPVPQVLFTSSGISPKAVLDLGCGSGAWIIDIGTEFPQVQAVGIDLTPHPTRGWPTNCRFETRDLNLGLQSYDGAFDIIHGRLITSGVKDYHNLIVQIAQILRPNGLMLLSECDIQSYDDEKRLLLPYPVGHPQRTALAAFQKLIRDSVRARGGGADSPGKLAEWARSIPSFINVRAEDLWISTRPRLSPDHAEYARLTRVGEMMRDDIKEFVSTCRPLVVGGGMAPAEADALIQAVGNQLDDPASSIFIRFNTVCAQKRG